MTITTKAQSMIAIYKENPIIHSFFNNRGLSDNDVGYLLNPNASHAHNPFLLRGVHQWIDKLHTLKGENIAIVPDYDADGVLSGTVARVGLHLFGFGDVYVYPPKTSDGYGLTRKSVDNVLLARPDTTVLITTDNGSNAHAGIAYAKSLGLTVLVTDHHIADTEPPADAHVNPNRAGEETYPFTQISGTTVIYKVLQAYMYKYILGQDNVTEAEAHNIANEYGTLVFLVGISTISDVMPLLNENRYYVTEAVNMLKRLIEGHSTERVLTHDDTPMGQYFRGVDLLVMTLDRHGKLLYGIDSDTFGFTIGPILNSPRRMTGDSILGFSLFQMTRSELRDAHTILPSEALYDMNEERKIYGRKLTKALLSHIATNCAEFQLSPVYFTAFNIRTGAGIAGLLASSFEKQYGLPSVAFSAPVDPTSNEVVNVDVSDCDMLSGSARSPEGFNLYAILEAIDEENPGLIVGWGGHPQAAGITIKAKNFETFRAEFSGKVQGLVTAALSKTVQPTNARKLLPIRGEYILSTETYVRLSSYYDTPKSSLAIQVNDRTPIVDHDNLVDSVRFFDKLSPFGQGLPEPSFSVIFSMDDVKPFYMGADKQHAKFTLPNGLSLIHWQNAELYRLDGEMHDSRMFAVTGKLGINEFRGKESLQIIVDDVTQL